MLSRLARLVFIGGRPAAPSGPPPPAPPAVSAAQSTASVPADGLVGDPTNITIQARDQYGDPWTTGGDTVVVTVSGANSATPTVTDNSDGTYSASYTPSADGSDSIAITLNGTAISGSPFASTVHAGLAVSAAHTTASVPATGATGVATNITVQARDSVGDPWPTGGDTVVVTVTGANSATPSVTDNTDGTYSTSYTPNNAGSDSVAITLNGDAISGSPYGSSVSLTLAPTAAQTTASVPSGGFVGTATNITVQVRDQNGDPWTTGGDTVVVTVSGDNSATPTVTDNSDGTYSASYTPGNTGSDSIAITLNATAISGSPFSSTVAAAPAVSAADTTATVPDGETDEPTNITVQVKDQYGNNWTTGGDTVVVTVSGANSATPTVTDNSDGTYSTSYTPTNGGADSVAITLNGDAISGSPYTSNVTAVIPDAVILDGLTVHSDLAYTRSGDKTYFDSDYDLQTAAADTWPAEYEQVPVTTQYFLRDTQTEAGATGTPANFGSVLDLATSQGTPATLGSGNQSNTSFEEAKAWTITVGDAITGSSFPTSLSISATSAGTLEYRWRIQRVNSSGTVQASSGYSDLHNTTGVKTATLTLATTWASGDRLRFSVELRKTSGGGGRNITFDVNSANSSVTANTGFVVNLLGHSVWEERENLLLHSRDGTNAAWFKSVGSTVALTETGIDGTANSATRFTSANANDFIGQGITSGNVLRTASGYVKRVTGSGGVDITIDGGFTWDSVTLTSEYTRVSTTLLVDGAAQMGFRLRVAGDAIAVDYMQAELGAPASPAILTTAATATRGADTAGVPLADIDYTREHAWTLEARTAKASGTQTAFEAYADADNYIRVLRNSSNEIRVVVYSGGSGIADLNAGTVANSTDFTLAVTMEDGNIAAVLNGGSPVTTSANPPDLTGGDLVVGRNQSDANYWNGTIDLLRREMP